MRQAGYNPETRAPYEIPDWRYTAGPAAGLPAVDPWDVARSLSVCGGTWRVWLREARESLIPLPVPEVCRSNACPVCASRRSFRLASSMRLLLAARWGVGTRRTVFVTLTQRARRGEPLAQALQRWRGAWSRLTRGRGGPSWRAVAEGWFYGVEVTRGRGSSRTRRGPHWHVHGHAIVRLAPRACWAAARGEVERLWIKATRDSAAALGYARPSHWGYHPAAGADGHWWAWLRDPGGWEIDPSLSAAAADAQAIDRVVSGDADELAQSAALARVFQAAKYPTPIASLCPLSLAEWLAVARGRRWHDGGGVWRGAIRQAEQLRGHVPPPFDLGSIICRGAPGDLPSLDAVSERLGVVDLVPSLGASPMGFPTRPAHASYSTGSSCGDLRGTGSLWRRLRGSNRRSWHWIYNWTPYEGQRRNRLFRRRRGPF